MKPQGALSGAREGAWNSAMTRFLMRFIGLLLLALAFIFVIHDGSLRGLQSLIERRLGGEAWQIGVAPVLDQPAAAIFCVLGIILILLGRKKKPLIGYARD